MARIFFFLILLFSSLSLPSFYRRSTHAFRPEKCLFNERSFALSSVDEKLRNVLQKPFFYLSKGRQAYVFVSEDGDYVLKLFRFPRCKAPYGQKIVAWARKSLSLKVKEEISSDEKREKTLLSLKHASERAPDLTALDYLHLGGEIEGLFKIEVKDRLRKRFLLDPKTCCFALQKRALPLFPLVEELIGRGDEKGVEELLNSFKNLALEMRSRCLVSFDRTMSRNFGVIGKEVVLIDFGDLDLASKEEVEMRWGEFETKLQLWVEKR